MSSLIEKILMIGFGATICLSLFSTISPLLNTLRLDSGNLKDNQDVLNFYEMVTEIKRKSEDAIQYPDQEFRIQKEFSSAIEIHFSKSNISTLTIEMERENQVFIDLIEFKKGFMMTDKNLTSESLFFLFTRTEVNGESIKISFDIIWDYLSLKFEF